MGLERAVELLRERSRRRSAAADPLTHAAAAMQWLCAAQDSDTDRGVAYGYLIGERWMRSYPETTGYILPTFLNWARLRGDHSYVQRALQMGDWEIAGQLASGAIPNLTGGDPTVFDTGQVIFGWVAAYRQGGDERYLNAARRGGDWLLSQLDAEGIWRHSADAGGPGRVYNVRSAWALLELHASTRDVRYAEAARAFLQWALRQESADGWFDHNCLTDDRIPLLHTIAYTAQGLLESGRLLGDANCVAAARRTSSQLSQRVARDGYMAGRFDREFRPAVRWACLTGMAQMSIVWRRSIALEFVSGAESERFLHAARSVNDFLMRTQDRNSKQAGLRGGIRGSYPVNGAYGSWKVLNWATKFFVDALLFELASDPFDYQG